MVFGEDDYTRELEYDRGIALWRAELSDGSLVVQDDGRPGCEPQSAWLRLREHLADEKLAIKRLWLTFRSNTKPDILPANAAGYFFAKSAIGIFTTTATMNLLLVGALLTERRLMVQRWSVPDLSLVEVSDRDPAKAGDCLIRNYQWEEIGQQRSLIQTS